MKDGDVTIVQGEDEHILPFAQMKAAHIVATEEMIRELLQASEDDADGEMIEEASDAKP